ncbi:MAG: hypothetical protein HWD86_03025 [Kangiellaceae bacterium]|nr:hypothetical protein [Kangiellaceae bacterium]
MKNITLTLFSLFFISSCAMHNKPAQTSDNISRSSSQASLSTSENAFFANLKSLCGQQFVGNTAYPDDPSHDFAGKKLVATVKSCSDTEIRIPFVVGEDHSRTWIISKTEQGLLLKHDHRHHDGTPDEVTMYGGFAKDYKDEQGTEYKQFFHADAHTANLIPAAQSNVWMLEYKPDSQELVYYLERHQNPRYKAILKEK